jgi:hypothetical protein
VEEFFEVSFNPPNKIRPLAKLRFSLFELFDKFSLVFEK